MKPRLHARKAIHDLTSLGWRPEDIASALRMAERTVFRHLRALRRAASEVSAASELERYHDARAEHEIELEAG